MKVKLEFDHEEEAHQARCAFHGFALWSALWDVDSECRNRMKHGDDVSEEEYAFLSNIRERCHIAHFVEEEL